MSDDLGAVDPTASRRISMSGQKGRRLVSRRMFLAGAAGATGLLVAGRTGMTGPTTRLRTMPVASASSLHLAATDGWASMPEAAPHTSFWPDPWAPPPYDMYVFGFRDVTGFTPANVTTPGVPETGLMASGSNEFILLPTTRRGP